MRFLLPSKGKILVISSILLAFASACGHPMQRRLQGRWLGESVENVNSSFLAAATGWAKGTSFEFSGDRLTVIIPAEDPRSGTYIIGTVHDDKVALQAKRLDGTLDPVELRMDDEHSLLWVLPNGASIRMRKAN